MYYKKVYYDSFETYVFFRINVSSNETKKHLPTTIDVLDFIIFTIISYLNDMED